MFFWLYIFTHIHRWPIIYIKVIITIYIILLMTFPIRVLLTSYAVVRCVRISISLFSSFSHVTLLIFPGICGDVQFSTPCIWPLSYFRYFPFSPGNLGTLCTWKATQILNLCPTSIHSSANAWPEAWHVLYQESRMKFRHIRWPSAVSSLTASRNSTGLDV